ncbi:MAG TPA: hypothetical protein VM429_09665 [Micropruina sp.]|jgi:hypothetical protein|nr:hypothetical protein [Micropruina sp.]
MPSNEPEPLVGTEAQAGPNGSAIIEVEVEGVMDGELIEGELDVMGAELLGADAVLVHAASGISRAALRPRILVEVRMALSPSAGIPAS